GASFGGALTTFHAAISTSVRAPINQRNDPQCRPRRRPQSRCCRTPERTTALFRLRATIPVRLTTQAAFTLRLGFLLLFPTSLGEVPPRALRGEHRRHSSTFRSAAMRPWVSARNRSCVSLSHC